MRELIVVESPKKARTIGKILGDRVKVVSSIGHVRDLPPHQLGIDVHNDFACQWQIVKGKEKIINAIRKDAEKADRVFLAADPDREGEAISWHLFVLLGKDDTHIKRIAFNEITRKAITNALKQPRDIDVNLYNSQKARRVLDRLVGYLISPLLYRNFKRNLSAGRVQSVALQLIVELEKQIIAFVPEEYWRFAATFSCPGGTFDAELKKKGGKKIVIAGEAQARKLEKALHQSAFTAKQVKRTRSYRNPPLPFKTSTLQQEANSRYGFSAARTMRIAQSLYEGKSLGRTEAVGLITYMRTDSTRVSQEAQAAAREYVRQTLALTAHTHTRRKQTGKQKIQDAHEAVRPTDPFREPAAVKPYLTADEYKIYQMIWSRFIGSFLGRAVYKKLSIQVVDTEGYVFETELFSLFDPGFLRIYSPLFKQKETPFPELKQGENVLLKKLTPSQHFTEPPHRFTEAALIKKLEALGIGRPSTYASILDTLVKRSYVKKEKKSLRPTFIGTVVSDVLKNNFSKLINVDFTADMEKQLDSIEQGQADWHTVIRDYFTLLMATIRGARDKLRQGLATDIVCEKCGAPMKVKFGKRGEFLGCSKYPACTHTMDFDVDDKLRIVPVKREASTEKTCPLCHKPLMLKQGKYGRFYGCTGYPSCTFTEPLECPAKPGFTIDMLPQSLRACPACGAPCAIQGTQYTNQLVCTNPSCRKRRPVNTGIPCPMPDCGGTLIERHRKERPYYTCSNRPDCPFTVPFQPVEDPCPACGFPVRYVRRGKTKTTITCANKSCKHKEQLQPEGATAKNT